MYEGETFRLGYGDIHTMEQEVCQAISQLEGFIPDAIYLFPCISRKMYLQEDMDHEIRSFEKLAPSVGFLSQCEVSSDCGAENTLNAAYLTLGLKELPKSRDKQINSVDFQLSSNTKRMAKLMYFMSKITFDLEEANRELEIHTSTDFLTGALNRKAFYSQLEYEVSKFRRYETTFAIVMMDIDFFKKVNDIYGHQVGDEVLVTVSKIVTSQLRESDIFARYGGEEFILLLPETNIIDAKKTAERVRFAIEKDTKRVASSSMPAITCSFGVSTFTSSDDEVTIIKRADDALYQAKKKGRNRVES